MGIEEQKKRKIVILMWRIEKIYKKRNKNEINDYRTSVFQAN